MPQQNTSESVAKQPQAVPTTNDLADAIRALVRGVVELAVENARIEHRLAEVEDELHHSAHHVIRHQHAAGRLPGFARRPRPHYADGGPCWPAG